KLIPFLKKRYISIPKSSEQSYFKRFITPLVERHHVFAEGFSIKTEQYEAIPLIVLSKTSDNGHILSLHFKYGPYVFKEPTQRRVTVKMNHDPEADTYVFHRIKRSIQWEENRLLELNAMGLKKSDSLFNHFEVSEPLKDLDHDGKFSAIDWLNDHVDLLTEKGFQIIQKEADKRFLFG